MYLTSPIAWWLCRSITYNQKWLYLLSFIALTFVWWLVHRNWKLQFKILINLSAFGPAVHNKQN